MTLEQLFRDMTSYKYIPEPHREIPKLTIGQRVNHKRFGNGIVIEINGEKSKITFDSGVEKELLSRFAQYSNAT